ncbi:Peptidase propeptide and YPEB domain protein [compost metagenome]|jgi:uncharacterized membrane protein YkoI|uniref:PepSY domain-containing protein n=2 Tax=Pseudomonas sp. TaxID=306 RepID=UPI000F93766E
MKTLTALFATAALALSANVALAKDLNPKQIVEVVQTNQIKPFTELEKAALAKHPGAILVEDESELEDSYGRLVYKVELRDAQNVEWKVEMDAKSGEILKDFQDR